MLKIPTGSIQEKGGKWYAVVNCYEPVPPDQKLVRRVRWFSTDYNATKTNRAKTKRLMEDVVLPEHAYETDPEKRHQKEQQERLFLEYLNTWVEEKRLSVAPLTYEGYRAQIDGKITAYFGPQKRCGGLSAAARETAKRLRAAQAVVPHPSRAAAARLFPAAQP